MILGILLYIAVQLLIGFYVSRHIRSEHDYFLAGRQLGYPLAIFSIFATWFGAESCIGASSEVYKHGLKGASIDPFAYGLSILILGLFFSVRLWKAELITLADLFKTHYSYRSERVVLFISLPTSILWAAAQIRAFGQVLSYQADFDLNVGILIATTFILIYTVSGGLLADSITDFIQGIILIIGLATLCYYIIDLLGGINNTFSQINWFRETEKSPDKSWLSHLELWMVPICGSIVSQELIARISASKSANHAYRSSIAAAILYISVGLMPVFIALTAQIISPDFQENEQILAHIAIQFLPPIAYVIFIGALVSSILSTVDSALLVCSSLFSHNFLLPILNINDEKLKVFYSRLTVIAFGIIAYLLAVRADSIFDLVFEASAFGTSGLIIVVIVTLFGFRTREITVIVTLIFGSISWLIGYFIFEFDTPYVYSLLLSLILFFTMNIFYPLKHREASETSHH